MRKYPDFGLTVYRAVKEAEFDFTIYHSPPSNCVYAPKEGRYQFSFVPEMFSIEPPIAGSFIEPHMITIEWEPMRGSYRPEDLDDETLSISIMLRRGVTLRAREDWVYQDIDGDVVVPCELLYKGMNPAHD